MVTLLWSIDDGEPALLSHIQLCELNCELEMFGEWFPRVVSGLRSSSARLKQFK